MFKIIISFYRYLLLATLMVFHQSNAEAISLKEVLINAYNNADHIKIKNFEKDISNIDYEAALTSLLPEFRYNYSQRFANTNMSGITFPDSALANPIFAAYAKDSKTIVNNISIRQSLSLYKMIPGTMAASSQNKSNEYGFDIFLGKFGMLVIQKYLDIVYLEHAIEMHTKMENLIQNKINKLEILTNYGLSKKDKLAIAKAQLSNIRAQKINLNSDLEVAKMEYYTIIQENPQNLQLPKLEDLKLTITNKEDFVEQVLHNNTTIQKAAIDTKLANTMFYLNNMNILPDINLELGMNDQNIANPSGQFGIKQQYIALNLSVGFNTTANTITNARKAYKAYRINQISEHINVETIKQDAHATWNQYIAARELMQASEETLRTATNALHEVRISMQSGLATAMDESEAEKIVLEADLGLLAAKRSIVILYYKIHNMLGINNLSTI